MKDNKKSLKNVLSAIIALLIVVGIGVAKRGEYIAKTLFKESKGIAELALRESEGEINSIRRSFSRNAGRAIYPTINSAERAARDRLNDESYSQLTETELLLENNNAKWFKVAKNDATTHYIDMSSIKKQKNGLIIVRDKIVIKNDPDVPENTSHILALLEFDCKAYRYRTLMSNLYTTEGNAITMEPLDWSSAEPDSPAMTISEFVWGYTDSIEYRKSE